MTEQKSRFERTEYELHDLKDFDVVSFDKNEKSGSNSTGMWFNHILLECSDRQLLSDLQDDPEFKGSEMRVAVYINERRLVHTQLAKLVSYFAHNMAQQKLDRANFHNFEKAVQESAKGLFERQGNELWDQFHKLHEQIENLTSQSSEVVDREWKRPYAHQITEEMVKAGINALGRFFDDSPELDFQGNVTGEEPEKFRDKAVEAVYRAMIAAREQNPVYTIKLPALGGDGISIRSMYRAELMEEIKESLRQQGLVFEGGNHK